MARLENQCFGDLNNVHFLRVVIFFNPMVITLCEELTYLLGKFFSNFGSI
jgi:hypothetical protein